MVTCRLLRDVFSMWKCTSVKMRLGTGLGMIGATVDIHVYGDTGVTAP